MQTLYRATLCTAAIMFIAAGCYKYPPPPASTLGDSYTQRERDERDEMLKDLKSLTRADAQRIAIKNNPNYLAAYHAVNAARMRYYQAIGAYSPTVTAGFQLQDSHSWSTHNVNQFNTNNGAHTESFTTGTTVRASLLLFNGFARYFAMKAAQHNVAYQESAEADRCRTLMQAVAVAYNEVLLAIENRRIADEDRKFQQILYKDSKYKYEAGAVPLSEVLNFEILMNNADVNMITADYQYDTAIYALAVMMGYPEGTLPSTISFPTDFKSDFGDLPSVEVYLDAALASRPDLKGYREQLEIARYQLYQQYGSYSPTVSAYAAFNYSTTLNRYNRHELYNDTYRINHSYNASPTFYYGISADWTIFNGFIRYNTMREYQANLAIADYNVAAQWFTVVGEVRAAYAKYVQSVRQARIHEKNRDLSAQQRDLVDEEYRAGNAELTRLNEAQRDFVQAQTNLASSYISIQNAKAQLDAAVGVNTAEYYLNQQENTAEKRTPGLEALGDLKTEPPQTAPQTPENKDVLPNITGDGGNASSAAPAPAKQEKTAGNAAPAKKQEKAQSAPAAAPAKPGKTAAPAIPDSATAPAPTKQ